jgi:MSHA biogenesis protein MshN
VAPIRTIGTKRRPVWLALGGAGLSAVAAAIYWSLPAAPTTDASQDVPVIARQASKAVNTMVATAPAIQPAPQLTVAVAEPVVVAPRQPQVKGPVPDWVRKATERPLEASSKPLLPIPPLGQSTPQVEPAVVKKMTVLSPEAEAQQHYDDAQVLHRAGKYDAAIGKYRQALERNPGMTSARIQLARLLQEKGQVDAALSLLRTGYEQRADDGLAIAAGRLLADLGQRDAALDWLQRGQAGLRPADHALMGALLSQALRHEEASRAYRRALAADPGQGGWLLGLGVALEAQGRLEEARTAYRNALDRGQFKPEVIQFLRERGGLSGQ